MRRSGSHRCRRHRYMNLSGGIFPDNHRYDKSNKLVPSLKIKFKHFEFKCDKRLDHQPWIYRCVILACCPNWEVCDNYKFAHISIENCQWDTCRTLRACWKNSKITSNNVAKMLYRRSNNIYPHFSKRNVCVCWPVLTMYFHSPEAERAFCGLAYLTTLGHIPLGVTSSSSRLLFWKSLIFVNLLNVEKKVRAKSPFIVRYFLQIKLLFHFLFIGVFS